eukprot:10573178-Alexandrium_andersonii.AAC.1
MSASLVGSEMCIRDSSTPHPTCTSEAPATVGAWEVLKEEAARRLRKAACLLYTSDAADDM